MKRPLAVGGLLGLFLVGAAAAQDPAEVTGSVVSTGNASLVIASDEGTLYTFIVDTTTALPSPAASAGDRVSVRYRRLDATRLLAVAVVLRAPASPPVSSTVEATPDGTSSAARGGRARAAASPVVILALVALGGLLGGLLLYRALSEAFLTSLPSSPSADVRSPEGERARRTLSDRSL